VIQIMTDGQEAYAHDKSRQLLQLLAVTACCSTCKI
jgi:hypothetical protein